MNYIKGFIAPLILIIIATLLIGGGAYVYMQQEQANPPASENNVALPQATSTALATNQTAPVAQTTNPQTAGWKTYTNAKYGFESKHPESYSVFHTSGDANISFRSPGCKMLASGGGEWPSDCQAYAIVVQQNKIIGGNEWTTTAVAGIQAEKMIQSDGMWDNMTQVLVQFQRGKNWYIQTFTFNSNKFQITEGIMNQILSSFKFTP
jgi:hypothetical protein